MNLYEVLLIVVATAAVAFSCWLVFWTDSAVRFAQSLETSSGSKIASEPWYPLYVRFQGMWLWVMIGFFLSLASRS